MLKKKFQIMAMIVGANHNFKINTFNYPKELFSACPIMKDWQKIKLSIIIIQYLCCK